MMNPVKPITGGTTKIATLFTMNGRITEPVEPRIDNVIPIWDCFTYLSKKLPNFVELSTLQSIFPSIDVNGNL